MSKSLKDTDYLSISTRVRAMESKLLTQERRSRMVEASSDEDAVKILAECGYGELSSLTAAHLDQVLAQARDEVYQDLGTSVPNGRLLDVFRMKYDYHNAKTMLKATAMGVDGTRLLTSGGRYSAEKLADDFHRGELRDYTPTFREAVTRARETLGATGDPQQADFILDKAYFTEMTASAEESGSAFLRGYVKLMADTANLRSAVRSARMGKGSDFLAQALVPGGNVDVSSILNAKNGDLTGVFRGGRLGEAAAAGASLASGGGSFTAFERLCDNALNDYVLQAKRVPFGEQPVLGYLFAREAELTAIRTILSGRMAGLSAETIRERLRDPYV